MITIDELEAALTDAAASHHEFESVYLNGVRDESWASYYAAYLLGRCNQLTLAPSVITGLLVAVDEAPWVQAAAAAVHTATVG